MLHCHRDPDGHAPGCRTPLSSGDAVPPQTESTAAAGGCARRSGCSRCRAVASLTHRRARKMRLWSPGGKPIPEGGFVVCTRGAHEEDGTCRPRRIWGCGGPQRPAPGQDPPPPGPSGLRDRETPQNHEFTATHSRGRSCHPVRLPP